MVCKTSNNHHHWGAKLQWINWLRRQTCVLNGHYTTMCSVLCEIACRYAGPRWTDTHPTNIISQWRDEWKSALVVKSSLVDYSTIQQPGFDLPRRYWALLNHFQTNQGHCASCQRIEPCSNQRAFVANAKRCHILSMAPRSPRQRGAAAIAGSWWLRCRMAEDIRLVNGLDNNNSNGVRSQLVVHKSVRSAGWFSVSALWSIQCFDTVWWQLSHLACNNLLRLPFKVFFGGPIPSLSNSDCMHTRLQFAQLLWYQTSN